MATSHRHAATSHTRAVASLLVLTNRPLGNRIRPHTSPVCPRSSSVSFQRPLPPGASAPSRTTPSLWPLAMLPSSSRSSDHAADGVATVATSALCAVSHSRRVLSRLRAPLDGVERHRQRVHPAAVAPQHR